MLTGLFPPDRSSGAASIYGHSVQDDLGGARKVLGVCPQHDVLFDSLTTREHIVFFALLKVRDDVHGDLRVQSARSLVAYDWKRTGLDSAYAISYLI